MTDREALIRSIVESPHDITLRLIFADWLEERGECERAEFIRVQCELAGIESVLCHQPGAALGDWCNDLLCPRCGRACALRRRERKLLDKIPAGSTQPNKFLWLGEAIQEACIFGRASPEQVAAGLEFRRGFVESVACTLADWIGEECPACKSNPGWGDGHLADADCVPCRGTGRLDAHGQEITLAQPVTTVRVTDMPIYQSSGNDTYYVGGLGRLPQEYWMGLEGLPSPKAARNALSTALIRWARQRAGLAELEVLK